MCKGNGKSTTILLFFDVFIIQQKCLKLHIYNNTAVKWNFWTTVMVRPVLQDRRLVCLSVCNVGWIKDATTQVCLYIVLDGKWEPTGASSPTERGTAAMSSPHFLAHVYCDQMVAHLSNCWALVYMTASLVLSSVTSIIPHVGVRAMKVFQIEFGLLKVVISLYMCGWSGQCIRA